MKSPSKNSSRAKAARIPVRLYYESRAEIALVRQAAERRGIGFNLFMRLAVLEASKHAMKAPLQSILGAQLSEPTPQPQVE